MRRWTAIALAVCLLVLCGCGKNEQPAEESQTLDVTTAEMLGGEKAEELPTEWKEQSVIKEGCGYILSETDFSALDLDIRAFGYQVQEALEREIENGWMPLAQSGLDGTELCRMYVRAPEDLNREIVQSFVFGETDLWCIRRYRTETDQVTGEWEASFVLEHWDDQKNLLAEIPIDENFGEPEEELYYIGLFSGPDGFLVMKTEGYVYFLDGTGAITHTLDLEGTSYSTCQDREGTLYLYKDGNSTIFSIDWENHTLGQPIVGGGFDDCVQPGVGEYDFFFRGGTSLRGVNVREGTVTELLRFADCDLSDVSSVYYVDEDTALAQIYSSFSGEAQMLTVRRVPEDQVPEKTVINLAVGIGETLKGIDWTNCTGNLAGEISEFNRTNGTYRIEPSIFYTNAELNLLMLSDELPDLIYWGSAEETPLIESYARKGYLADLEPLFGADAELTLDHFYPQIIEYARSVDGGLYRMPTDVGLGTLAANPAYVGTENGWTFSEMYAIMQTLPEEMEKPRQWSGMFHAGQFVDEKTGTCNFHDPEFEALMNIAREMEQMQPLPEGTDTTYLYSLEAVAAEDMFYVGGMLGGSLFPGYDLPACKDLGLNAIGYPCVGGNGAVMEPRNSFSICAAGDQQAGAWEFMQNYYSYSYQEKGSSFRGSIRIDANEASLREQLNWVENKDDYTEEDIQMVLELWRDAVAPESDYQVLTILWEETPAYFSGDRSFSELADILENRVSIYLSEQS